MRARNFLTQADWLIETIRNADGPCIEWPFTINHKGYGRVFFGGKKRPAHRLALALHDGYCQQVLEAAHTCHNRKCVNPNHLYWASPKRNKLDCILRGTQPHKLTQDQVAEIKSSDADTRTLAQKFAVSTQAIRDVRKGRSWGWLNEQQRGGRRANTQ